jgi:hypothetical protein
MPEWYNYGMKKIFKKVKEAIKPKVVEEVKTTGFDPDLPEGKQREYR